MHFSVLYEVNEEPQYDPTNPPNDIFVSSEMNAIIT